MPFSNKKKIFLAALPLCVLIIVLALAAAFFLNSDSARLKVLNLINNQIQGRIEAEDHHISLLRGHIQLEGIYVKSADGETLAHVKAFETSVSWAALVRKIIFIPQLRVDNPSLLLKMDDQNQLSLVQALSPSSVKTMDKSESKPFTWQVILDRMKIINASIIFTQPSKQIDVRAVGLNVAAGFNLKEMNGSIKMMLDRLATQTAKINNSVRELSLEAAYTEKASRPIHVSLKTKGSGAQFSGKVFSLKNRLNVQGLLKWALSLSELKPWMAIPGETKGLLTGQLDIKGPVDDPEAVLELAMSEGQFVNVPVSDLKNTIELKQRKITLSQLHANTGYGRVDLKGSADLSSIFAQNFSRQTAGWEKLSYEFTLNGREVQPHNWPGMKIPVNATLQLDARIKGSGISPDGVKGQGHIQMAADFSGAKGAKKSGKANLETRMNWLGQKASISGFVLTAGANKLNLNGDIDAKSRKINIKGNLDAPEPELFGQLLGVGVPSGKLQAKLDCSGSWLQPVVKAQVLAEAMEYENYSLGRFIVEAELNDKGVLHVPLLTLENQDSLVQGSGSMSLFKSGGGILSDPNVSAQVKFDHVQASDFGFDAQWDTDISAKATVTGTLKKIKARMDLKNSHLTWRNLEYQADGAITWKDNFLDINTLKVVKDKAKLDIKGGVDMNDARTGKMASQPKINADIRLNSISLADFHKNISGLVNGKAHIQGRLPALKADLNLQAGDIQAWGQKIQGTSIQARFQDQTVYLDELKAVLDGKNPIRASGWYSLDERFEVAVKGKGIDLKKIQSLQKAYPAGGALNIQANGKGSLKSPDFNCNVTVQRPMFKDQVLDDFKITAKLKDKDFEVAANLNFDLNAKGSLSNNRFDATASFDKTDLTPYLSFFKTVPLTGQCSGNIKASGNWLDLLSIKADIALNDTQLLHQQVNVVGIKKFSARLENGSLNLPSTRIALMDDGYLNLQAQGRLPENIKAAAQGQLPLDTLAPFTEKLAEPTGKIGIDAHISGDLSKPKWRVKLTSADIGFQLPEFYQTVSELNGHIFLTPEAVSVKEFKGKMDIGQFSLEGAISLADLKPVNGKLVLEAISIPVQVPDYMDLVLSGKLTLSGARNNAKLEGALTLLEGTYFKDMSLNPLPMFSRRKRKQSVHLPVKQPDWMKHVLLDVHLGYRNSLLVDNNMAQLTIVPDLQVSGSIAKPVLTGRAKVVEGEIIYRQKSFEIERGVVDFVNPYKIEPELDIESVAEIRDWVITLTISGTPDKLALKLESDPAESENDLLSLILLGRTNREMMSGEGGEGQNTQQMLATLASSALGDDFKETTGMDILEVETGAQDDDDDEDRIELTVGKKLTRRLTLKYAMESSQGEMVQKAVSEYRFLEPVMANGFQDSKGGYGGELLFRIEFR
ncbi:MAG: AsmA family protein [Desulfobacteraceae bacterium]|nr:AsmA family protein [Desulfobacteraceae bacterium]